MSRADLDAQRASFNAEFSGASENIALGNGEYWGPYYPLRWGQWQKAWQAALASQAPAVQSSTIDISTPTHMRIFDIAGMLLNYRCAATSEKADEFKSAIIAAVREITEYSSQAPAVQQETDRFFMDHGMWHDRVSGQYMYTEDEFYEKYREGLATGKENAILAAPSPQRDADEIKLPDLPGAKGYVEYSTGSHTNRVSCAYTEHQMRDYARAAIDAARKEK